MVPDGRGDDALPGADGGGDVVRLGHLRADRVDDRHLKNVSSVTLPIGSCHMVIPPNWTLMFREIAWISFSRLPGQGSSN